MKEIMAKTIVTRKYLQKKKNLNPSEFTDATKGTQLEDF